MKKKVIHILGRLDRGGAEVWLKQLNEEAQFSQYTFIFLTLKKGQGYFDNEVIDKGAKVFNLPLSNSITFYIKLYKFFRNEQPDVVHSHVLNFSGIILFIAYLAGVRKRISHSHSDKSEIDSNSNFIRKVYLNFSVYLLSKFSTKKIACSEKAGKSLFKKDYILLDNGIDFKKFPNFSLIEKNNLKEKFNIDESKIVIGHVGRFSVPKNHYFIVDIAKEIKKQNLNFVILLVGEGELFSKVKGLIYDFGLDNQIKMLGARDDIPNLMVNLFDIMIFPSLYEGMPLTLIESQKAELYTLISDTIPRDVIKIKELFNILPINNGVDNWIKELRCFDKEKNKEINNIEEQLKDFSIESSFNKLIKYYQ